MGALKAALTAIFNTNNYTASTSGISSKKIPVTESSGLPTGQIGMAALASVMEGRDFTPLTSGDLNSYVTPGDRMVVSPSSSVSNRPITTATICVFVIGSSSYKFQLAFAPSQGTFYLRTYSGGWLAWKLVSMTAV